jgi:hypothetical protein
MSPRDLSPEVRELVFQLLGITRGYAAKAATRAGEQLDPPMWFESKTGCFYFEDERLSGYYISWLRSVFGSYGCFTPTSDSLFIETLEEAHASLCCDAYYDGVLKDDRWMIRCDECDHDWVADAGRMLPDDVWATIAKPEEFLCDSCIAKRLAAHEGSA